eukprot:GAHX01000711.1.p1 GENE.GAHX01000711.1~~GAHX01000711.1.p1  ORF type:complete len:1169 (+),score=271.04 GAHX01000711.1:45-3509(+)
MDENTTILKLQQTLSPTEHIQAEEYFKATSKEPGFVFMLLKILCRKDLPPNIPHAAILVCKNKIEKNIKHLSAQDLSKVIEMIFKIHMGGDFAQNIENGLLDCYDKVVFLSYPTKIPKLAGIYWALKKSVFPKETEIDNLEATNPNLKTSYKILQLFYPIYRKYKILDQTKQAAHKSEMETCVMDLIKTYVHDTPQLIQTLNNHSAEIKEDNALLNNTIKYFGLKHRIMKNIIDKSMESTNHNLKLVSEELLSSNLGTETLINFITTKCVIPLIKQVYTIPVTVTEYKMALTEDSSELGSEIVKHAKSMFNLLESISRLLQSEFTKHANPELHSAMICEILGLTTNYSSLMNAKGNELSTLMQKDVLFVIMFTFLKLCLKKGELYKTFIEPEQNFNYIFSEILFNVINFNESEMSLFVHDPQEFTLVIENSFENSDDVRQNSFLFIKDLFKYRTKIATEKVFSFLNQLSGILRGQNESLLTDSNSYHKLIFGVQVLDAIYSLAEKNNIKSDFDSLAFNIIVPLLKLTKTNNHDYNVRLELIQYLLTNFFFNNENALEEEFRSTQILLVLQNLGIDKNTNKIIRRESLFAFMEIVCKLSHSSKVLEQFNLEAILYSLIELLEFYNNSVVIIELLCKVIRTASTLIAPYTVKIAKELNVKALEYVKGLDNEDDNVGLLPVLNIITFSCQESVDIAMNLENIYMELVDYCLSSDLNEMVLSEMLEICCNFVSIRLNSGMFLGDFWWNVFPNICKLFDKLGVEYSEELMLLVEDYFNCPSYLIYTSPNIDCVLDVLKNLVQNNGIGQAKGEVQNVTQAHGPVEDDYEDYEGEYAKYICSMISTLFINSVKANQTGNLIHAGLYNKLADISFMMFRYYIRYMSIHNDDEDKESDLQYTIISTNSYYYFDVFAAMLFSHPENFFNYITSKGLDTNYIFTIFTSHTNYQLVKGDTLDRYWFFTRRFVVAMSSLFLNNDMMVKLTSDVSFNKELLLKSVKHVMRILIKRKKLTGTDEYSGNKLNMSNLLQKLSSDEDLMEEIKDVFTQERNSNNNLILNLADDQDFKEELVEEAKAQNSQAGTENEGGEESDDDSEFDDVDLENMEMDSAMSQLNEIELAGMGLTNLTNIIEGFNNETLLTLLNAGEIESFNNLIKEEQRKS